MNRAEALQRLEQVRETLSGNDREAVEWVLKYVGGLEEHMRRMKKALETDKLWLEMIPGLHGLSLATHHIYSALAFDPEKGWPE